MARKPRRRMGRYIRGNIDVDIAMGTLAAQTAQLFATDTVKERTYVSSMVNSYSLSGVTPVENTGPVQVGVAHSDYSLSEVEAWIEQVTGWDEADLVAQEIAKRKIRRIGVFANPATLVESSRLADGRMVKTRLGWILLQGQGLNIWVYNMGVVAFATTDPNVNVSGHANLWPK